LSCHSEPFAVILSQPAAGRRSEESLSFTAQGKLRQESPYLPKRMPRPFAALRMTVAATLDS